MNEELQHKTVEILTQIQTTVGQTKDFVLTQAPDIIQSYVLWGRVAFIKDTLVALLIVALWARWVGKGRLDVLLKADSYEGRTQMTWFTLICVGVMSFMYIGCYLAIVDNGIMSFVAPKVWLIKELAASLK